MKASIRMKVIALMMVVILIPMSLVGLISIVKLRSSTEGLVAERLEELSSLTAELIAAEIAEADALTNAMSKHTSLVDYAAGDDTLKIEAYEYLKRMYEDSDDAIEMFVLLDNRGKGKIAHNDLALDVDMSEMAFYMENFRGLSAQSSVILSPITGEEVVVIAYPLVQYGRPIGSLVTTLRFSALAEKAHQISVYDSGYGFIFDHGGRVLWQPDNSDLGSDQLLDLDQEEMTLMVEGVGRQEGGAYTFQQEGVRKYMAYKPVASMGIGLIAYYDDYMITAHEISRLLVLIGVLSVVFAMMVSYLFTEFNLVRPIRRITEQMAIAGTGDLRVQVQVTTKDEIQIIGDSFNQMMSTQHDVVSKVRSEGKRLAKASCDIVDTTVSIGESSESIGESIASVARNIEEQNEGIRSATTIVEGLTDSIQKSRENATKTSGYADEMLRVVDQGRIGLDTTMKSMVGIQSGVDDTNQHLNQLEVLSDQVKGVIDMINGLAKQTNLLALNASIEAARAGDQGKGFAVVASEVRQLSEETRLRANHIHEVVGAMVVKIGEAVESIGRSSKAVTVGVGHTEGINQVFHTIQRTIHTIAEDIDKTLVLTQEEVVGSEAITKQMAHVKALSKENAKQAKAVVQSTQGQEKLMKALENSSEDLAAMGQEMDLMVDYFSLNSSETVGSLPGDA